MIEPVEHSDVYLGDGLYLRDDGYQVELFAHNGIHKTNSVFLDSDTMRHFLVWIAQSRFQT